MEKNIKKIVIFGESNTSNVLFYNAIRRFLTISQNRLQSNQNNYLETFFTIGENKYILTSISSSLFFHKNDNDIDREEKALNQELLLSSDVVYLFINSDNLNADLDYNLRIQKYLNQNRKRHLVIFNSNHVNRREFENSFLLSIPVQRIIRNSHQSFFFFFLNNDYLQLRQFIYDQFSFDKDLDKVINLSNQEGSPKLTIFGPPNSGKSTLLNTLLGTKRSIVSPLAGTTREEVTSLFQWKGIFFEIKDTEGVVISKRNDHSILGDCQISWVVIDSTEPITKKTLQIISLAERCNRAVIIILNKMDIASMQQVNDKREEISLRLKSFFFVPIIAISAQKKSNLPHLLTILESSVSQSQLTFGKSLLAQQFQKILEKNPPAAIRGRHLKVYYALHQSGFVHKFVVFVNDPQLVHFSYHRYIVNCLRRNLKINSLPIRIFFKKS